MRYVLLLLTILTAALSIWYYRNNITPEGEALAARRLQMEQDAVTIQKTANECREKLNAAQDVTQEAEIAAEQFQARYLDKKREQYQEHADASYRQAMQEQEAEVNGHNQKINHIRLRLAKQKENDKAARQELLEKKEQMRTLLSRLAEKQRNLQTEITREARDTAKTREEGKARKKSSGQPSSKGNTEELQAQISRIQRARAGAQEKIRDLDAALAAQEEEAGKRELLMQKAEEKLTQQKNAALADDDHEAAPAMMDVTDDDLLATADYREQSRAVRQAFAQAQKEEERASRAYDRARAAMGKASRDELARLVKEEKDHGAFRKLFTGAASVVGFILLLLTAGAFRRVN